jgi:hypothetical protein
VNEDGDRTNVFRRLKGSQQCIFQEVAARCRRRGSCLRRGGLG